MSDQMLSSEFKNELRTFMHEEFSNFLQDVEYRVSQAYDVERRSGGGAVYAEDLNLMEHRITGYTMTPNSPTNGSIAWTAVHIVYAGVDYTIADGNTANRYAWFVKPASGTTATLQTSNTKPTLTVNDCLVFVNNNGTPTNALTTTLPVALADGAVDTGAISVGAVTADKTDFAAGLSAAIVAAQSDATAAMAKADGAIVSHFQETAPWADGTVQAAEKTGDMWYKPSNGQAYRWTGPTPGGAIPVNKWYLIEDSDITAAMTAANNAQTTANSRITTFYAVAASPPTALAVGDLWIVTDQGNQLRRATATGSSSWVTVQISGAAIASGGVGNTQLGSGIDGAKLSASTVTATQLAANSVTPTKLNTLQHIMF